MVLVLENIFHKTIRLLFLSLCSSIGEIAKKCYNKTAEHKAAVDKLKTLEDVESYDYKSGYPERLNLEV